MNLINISKKFNKLNCVNHCSLKLGRSNKPILKVYYYPTSGASMNFDGDTNYGVITFHSPHNYSLDALGEQERPKELMQLTKEIAN